jgi:DNA-binding NarL/FixJ family response regulator
MTEHAQSSPGRALIVTTTGTDAQPAEAILREHGLEPVTEFNPERALELCRESTPALVIVDETAAGTSAGGFIKDLLGISWTVSTIVVSDKDAETVHEMTEGLGIVGSISDYNDREGLQKLLAGIL